MSIAKCYRSNSWPLVDFDFPCKLLYLSGTTKSRQPRTRKAPSGLNEYQVKPAETCIFKSGPGTKIRYVSDWKNPIALPSPPYKVFRQARQRVRRALLGHIPFPLVRISESCCWLLLSWYQWAGSRIPSQPWSHSKFLYSALGTLPSLATSRAWTSHRKITPNWCAGSC